MTEGTQELQIQETQKQELAEESAERTRARTAFVPQVDIYETDQEVVVVADMPGVREDAIDITLEKNILTLNGYVEPEAPEGYQMAYSEYRMGDYVRSFKLSNEIDQEHIEATLKDGVLRLHLPKAQTIMRKIAVSAA